MLVAERGDPHASKVLSYSLTGTNWNYNLQYFVGGFTGGNSAGGVDFYSKEKSDSCDEFFWATWNYMTARSLPNSRDKAYGLEGISYGGNNSATVTVGTANQDTDLFIDLDGAYTTVVKSSIGDVEVFDAAECFDLCNFQ